MSFVVARRPRKISSYKEQMPAVLSLFFSLRHLRDLKSTINPKRTYKKYMYAYRVCFVDGVVLEREAKLLQSSHILRLRKQTSYLCCLVYDYESRLVLVLPCYTWYINCFGQKLKNLQGPLGSSNLSPNVSYISVLRRKVLAGT